MYVYYRIDKTFMAKTGEKYYFGRKKEDDRCIICTSRTVLGKFVGVHSITIKRWLKSSNPYESRDYMIYCGEVERVEGRGGGGGFR